VVCAIVLVDVTRIGLILAGLKGPGFAVVAFCCTDEWLLLIGS